MSFADFMETALYHPLWGYYTRLGGFGSAGDFVTSPETHPAFGALLGRQVLDLWEALATPERIVVQELGGGAGSLARGLLEWARIEAPHLDRALEYWIDERSPTLRTVQQEALSAYPVRWGRSPRPPGFILANELLDAFPVHRVVIRDGHPRELRVGLSSEDRFAWIEADRAPPEVTAYFARLRLLPPEGGVAEVNARLPAWIREIAAWVQRGLILVLDYGYLAGDLFARAQGTLLTYYRHTLGSDPLVRVGQQDISAHVDFTTLSSAAQAAGLRVLGLASQRTLLHHLGLQQHLRLPGDAANQRALTALVDPLGLGRIQALFLSRGLDEYQPVGLRGGRAWPPLVHRPALPADAAPDDFLDLWREAFGDAG